MKIYHEMFQFIHIAITRCLNFREFKNVKIVLCTVSQKFHPLKISQYTVTHLELTNYVLLFYYVMQ